MYVLDSNQNVRMKYFLFCSLRIKWIMLYDEIASLSHNHGEENVSFKYFFTADCLLYIINAVMKKIKLGNIKREKMCGEIFYKLVISSPVKICYVY